MYGKCEKRWNFDYAKEQEEPKETRFDLFLHPVEMKRDQMN